MLKKILILFVNACILLIADCYAQVEYINITTYYPSPYGVYRRLRLYPGAPNPGEGPGTACSKPGELYVDSSDNALYICSGTPATWIPAGGGGGPGPGTGDYWDEAPTNSNNIYSLKPGNVGIGTANPSAKLDIYNPSGTALTLAARLQNLNNAANQNGLLVYVARPTSDAYVLNAQSGGASRLYVRTDGNVGIGTTAPASRLQVAGGVQVGPDNNALTTCTAAKGGTFRYKNNVMEYCNGAQWVSSSAPATTFVACRNPPSTNSGCTPNTQYDCTCGTGTQVTRITAPCTVTSDTGSCSANIGTCWPSSTTWGTCCVCRP